MVVVVVVVGVGDGQGTDKSVVLKPDNSSIQFVEGFEVSKYTHSEIDPIGISLSIFN